MEIIASYSLKAKDLTKGKGIAFEFDNGLYMQKWQNGQIDFRSAKCSMGKRRDLNAKQNAKKIEEMKAAVAKRFK